MSFDVVPVHFSNDKNCFISLPSPIIKKIANKSELLVFEVQTDDGITVYASVKDVTSNNYLGINGLFAEKLKLKDTQQVIVRVKRNVPICSQVSIEPLSCDDWEILEKHASYVESHLLDQVRVVWSGLVLPVWVERNVCVYLKITVTNPAEECVLLVTDTEVVVSPKVRGGAFSDSKVRKHSPSPARGEDKLKFSGEKSFDSNSSVSDGYSSRMEIPSKWNWKEWVPWLLGVQNTSNRIQEPFRGIPNFRKKSIDYKKMDIIQEGLNLAFRVQPQRIRNMGKKGKKEEPVSPTTSSEDLKECPFLQQPAVVFVNTEDIIEQTGNMSLHVPGMFLARLSKLFSPKVQMAEMEKELNEEKNKGKQKSVRSTKGENEKDPPSKEKDHLTQCIVRVVVLDKKKTNTNVHCEQMLNEVTRDHPILCHHVLVPDTLRRLMKLDATSCVWLQTISTLPVMPTSYEVYPVGSLPPNFTSQMVEMAFRRWITVATSVNLPLVVFSGIIVDFPLFKDKNMEFQLVFPGTVHQQDPDIPPYSLVYQGNMNDAPLNVVIPDSHAPPQWPVLPMLQYTNLDTIDPMLPRTQLSDLGGVEEYIPKALSHLEICLGMKPLADGMFNMTTPGLSNGMLLITGSRGSGKSSLAKALCRKMAEKENLAHIFYVECKPLRGKRPDSILKYLEEVFDEAVWRQPSIILLDDLDHVVPAPSGPEAELGGEAIYGARIGEVIRDILRKEITNGGLLAVIATSQSRNSIHPLLMTSRGTHFLQELIRINPPDKKKRQEIFRAIIRNRHMVSQQTLEELDLNVILGRTEGYVAQDLENLVSRAIHAHTIKQERDPNQSADKPQPEMVLTQSDFTEALSGFTPASIRNVPLHQAGELGWEDVGGLTDVKKTLMETLMWPSKYPMLFSSCPLRLRSGLLLYGAPGTGKTLLAGVVAKECGLNFISIKGPELLSKYIGASEQAVRDNFVRAQSAKPCILFFDEFDSLAPRRGHDNTGVTDRVVNQLLTQLDGVEGLEGVYVLAATSRPDLIDPALLRPGRLDKCLQCKLPNEEERLKIFKALTRKMSLGKTVDLEYFAKECEHFSGADIKALLYNAQLEAIHELTGKVLKGENPDLLLPPAESNKNQRSPRVPRKSKSQKLLKVETVPPKLSTNKKIAHIPKLQDGPSPLTEEVEEKLSSQVEQIRGRLMVNKATEHVSTVDSMFSPVTTSKGQLIQINQSHLQAALKKTHPSVNEKERMKFQQIYANFTASKGGSPGTSIEQMIGSRQTLA
ncbi:peroxisomal ATPase PEX1-like [Saccostrea cucullata]|uniref:peroxisomal ATPase PEX1-like n=1 Tax=Saccostrea cuccullata TaxID=36930 RepID=UPI002ED5EA3E